MYISKCKRSRYRRKKKKIDSWLFDRKINVALLYKHILIEKMNVNTTLVEKGKRFMHIGIQYLVGVYLFFPGENIDIKVINFKPFLSRINK